MTGAVKIKYLADVPDDELAAAIAGVAAIAPRLALATPAPAGSTIFGALNMAVAITGAAGIAASWATRSAWKRSVSCAALAQIDTLVD
jgi:hypothetical protein